MNPKISQMAQTLNEISKLIGGDPTEVIMLSNNEIIRPGLGMKSDFAYLNQRAHDLERGIFKILLLGEFNHGKSTLLNALLGSNVSPARSDPTTSIITEVVYGSNPKVAIYETGSLTPSYISREEFEKAYTVNNEEDSSKVNDGAKHLQNIQYVEIEHLSALLANGVHFVDSPGLGEHLNRSRITLNYLRQAQAILFVLSAPNLFSQSERDFFPLFGDGRSQNIFFIINRIDLVGIKKTSIEKIDAFCRKILRQFYVDSANNFNEDLYREHVFFTNAFDAFNSRVQSPADDETYEKSGVMRLEQTLTKLVHSDERIDAILQSSIEILISIFGEARHRIQWKKEMLAQPLEKLKTRITDTNQRLNQLEASQQTLNVQIQRYGENITDKVFSNLLSHLDLMESRWGDDAKKLTFTHLSISELLQATVLPDTRKQLAEKISLEVRTYFYKELTTWAESIPTLVESDVNALAEYINNEAVAFAVNLEQINKFFSDSSTGPKNNTSTIREHLFSSRTTGVFVNTLSSLESWNKLIGSLIQNVVILILAVVLIPQIIVLLVTSIVGGLLIWVKADDIKQNIIEEIGKKMFELLRTELKKKRGAINQEIGRTFNELALTVNQYFQAQVNEMREQYSSILVERENRDLFIKEEEKRLTDVEHAIKERFDFLTELTYNKTFTVAEIDELAQGKTILSLLDEQEKELTVEKDDLASRQPADLPLSISENKPVLSSEEISGWVRNIFKQSLLPNVSQAEMNEIESLSQELAQMIGLEQAKQKMLELAAHAAEEKRREKVGRKNELRNLHMVFYGNPGTGKTTVARLISHLYQKMGLLKTDRFVEKKVDEINSKWVGDTAKLIASFVREAQDGVLFLDEAYLLVEHYGAKDAIGALVPLLEEKREQFVCIIAGYTDKMEKFLKENDGLAERFPLFNRFYFPDYSPEELMMILKKLAADGQFVFSEVTLKQLERVVEGIYITRDAKNFGNARAMRNLLEAMVIKHDRRVNRGGLSVEEPIQVEDIPDHYAKTVIAGAENLDNVMNELDQLIGLAPVKLIIRNLISRYQGIKRAEEHGKKPASKNLSSGHHMVFVGNPGTGKTSVARIIGRALKAAGILRRGHTIESTKSNLTGHPLDQNTSELVKEYLHRALDGVLFIDEAYSLLEGYQGVGHDVINELVTGMENNRDRVVVIMAGYKPDMERLLHSNQGLKSRFTSIVEFPDFIDEELTEITKKYAQEEEFTLSDVALLRAQAYLKALKQQDSFSFGNGRAVRTLVEEIKSNFYVRLGNEKDPIKADRILDEKILEAEDVPPIPPYSSKESLTSSNLNILNSTIPKQSIDDDEDQPLLDEGPTRSL